MRIPTCRVAGSILALVCVQVGLIPPAQAAADRSSRTTLLVAAADEASRRAPPSDTCEQTRDDAQAALAAAVHRRETGVEPQPGERQRLANGFSKLRPVYFERQRQLDRDVVMARRCLASATPSPE